MDTKHLDGTKELAGRGGLGNYDWDLINIYPSNDNFESSVLPENIKFVGKVEKAYNLNDPYTKSTTMINLLADDKSHVSAVRLYGHVENLKISFKYKLTEIVPSIFQGDLTGTVTILTASEVANFDIPLDVKKDIWHSVDFDFSGMVIDKNNVVFKIQIEVVNSSYKLSVSDIKIPWKTPIKKFGENGRVILKPNPSCKYADVVIKDEKESSIVPVTFDNLSQMPDDRLPPQWQDMTFPFWWGRHTFDLSGEGGPVMLPSMWDDIAGCYDITNSACTSTDGDSWYGPQYSYIPIVPNAFIWKSFQSTTKIRMQIEYDPNITVWDNSTGAYETITYIVECVSDFDKSYINGDPANILDQRVFSQGADFNFNDYYFFDVNVYGDWTIWEPNNAVLTVDVNGDFRSYQMGEAPQSLILVLTTRITNYTGDPNSLSQILTDNNYYPGYIEYPQEQGCIYFNNLFRPDLAPSGQLKIKKIEVMCDRVSDDWFDISDASVWQIVVDGWKYSNSQILNSYDLLYFASQDNTYLLDGYDRNKSQYIDANLRLAPIWDDFSYIVKQVDTVGTILAPNSIIGNRLTLSKTKQPNSEVYTILDGTPKRLQIYGYVNDGNFGFSQDVDMLIEGDSNGTIYYAIGNNRPVTTLSNILTGKIHVTDVALIEAFGIDSNGVYTDKSSISVLTNPPDATFNELEYNMDNWIVYYGYLDKQVYLYDQFGRMLKYLNYLRNGDGNWWSNTVNLQVYPKIPFDFQKIRIKFYSYASYYNRLYAATSTLPVTYVDLANGIMEIGPGTFLNGESIYLSFSFSSYSTTVYVTNIHITY